MLALGRDDDDPLFLQFKEAEASVLEPFLGRSEYQNHGQRVVEGQRLTQAASDIMLGWIRTEGFDGVKRDFDVRHCGTRRDRRSSSSWSRRCWPATARSRHRARASTRPVRRLDRHRLVSRSEDTFDRALAEFAEAYADQNERDHETLTEAVKSGLIEATPGV